MPSLRGLYTVLFSFFFSLFSAQDSLLVKTSSEAQITVLGKAQIYSSDESFNQIVTGETVKVIASVRHNLDGNTLSLTAAKNAKSLSQESKLSREKISSLVDTQVLDQLKEIAEKATVNGISVKNHASDEFFYAGKTSRISFLVPDSQNHAQNILSLSLIELSLTPVISENSNSFYFNTRSKTFGYSKTYSLRPPPVLELI